MPPPDSGAEIVEPRDPWARLQPLNLRQVRERVSRLEARAVERLHEGDPAMIDFARIIELHGKGLS